MCGTVAQGQARYLDRRVERDELQQVTFDAVDGGIKSAEAAAVPRRIGRRGIADWLGRRAPQREAVGVAQIEGLARAIGDGVVRPGGELVLAAVDRPGVAAALGRRLEAEAGIGDHIDPRRRRGLAGPQTGDVLGAIVVKTAKPVEELQCRRGGRHGGRRNGATRQSGTRKVGEQGGQTVHLIGQAAAAGEQNNAGRRLQQGPRIGGDEIGAQDDDPAGPCILARLSTGAVGAQQGIKRDLEVLRVGGLPVVQNDEVHREAFHPPVFMGFQQRPGDIEMFDVVDAQQHDRQIAGDTLAPQPGLWAGTGGDAARRRAQTGRRVDDMAGQPLEQPRVAGGDAKVVELHLGLCPGQCGGAGEGDRVAMAVDTGQHRIPAFGDHGPVVQSHGGAGGNRHPPAHCEDRVKHGADGAGQDRTGLHGGGMAQRIATAEEAGAVGLDLRWRRGGLGGLVEDAEMGGPDRRFAWCTAAAGGEECAQVRHIFGFDEELRECGVGNVGALRGKHELDVGGDIDHAPAASGVGEADPADLRVILAGDDNLHPGDHGRIGPDELGTILLERDLAGAGCFAGRLESGGPNSPCLDVAQQDVATGIVAGRILAPPRDGQVAPSAVARAGGREHRGELAIGQQEAGRICLAGRAEIAAGGRLRVALGGRGSDLGSPGMGGGNVAGHALLQQQLGRLHHRLAVEPGAHGAAEHGVGDGHDRHALVMRHEGAHHRELGTERDARRREVERLIEAIGAPRAALDQPGEVFDGRTRVNHGGKGRRIRRDDEVLAQATLEAKVGNPEIGVLVGEFEIARVVGRFRDAPGAAPLGAIVDLALHDQPAGVFKQAVLRRAHHQSGHQVFEHRTRPGDQRSIRAHPGGGTAEVEPVPRRNITLGDRHEAGKAGFGGQKVVAAGVERPLGDQKADRQQLAGGIEQEAELHRLRHHRRGVLDAAKALGEAGRGIVAVRGDGAHNRGCPEQHVVGGVGAVLGQGLREAMRRLGLDHEGGSVAGRAVGRGVRNSLQADQDRVERLGDVRRRAMPIIQARDRGAGQADRIADAGTIGSAGGADPPVMRRVGQRDEVPGQIAAIDRGDVARVERAQVGRVVPVVEMPPETRELCHLRKRRLQPVDHLRGADPAEVAGADDGEQIEADIGRRGPMGQDGVRVLLEVVGRQHVICGGDETLEEAPCQPGGLAQDLRLRTGDRRALAGQPRLADPPGKHRGDTPRRGEQGRERPGTIAGKRRQHQAGNAQDGTTSHPRSKPGQGQAIPAGGLGRGDPFQQMAAAGEQAPQRAADRIAHQPGLVGKEGDGECDVRDGPAQVGGQRPQMACHGDIGRARHHTRQHRDHDRQQHRGKHEPRPHQRGAERQCEADRQRRDAGRCGEAAPQVVEHLPSPDGRNGTMRGAGPVRRSAPADDPRQQLPVATGPPVVAQRADVVARGEILHHFDVGGQCGAGEDALEQVVAEHGAVRHTTRQRGLERVDVVDALAGIGTLAEQVLVDVRDGGGVGVDATGAGEDALVVRTITPHRQGGCHARLEYTVARDDPATGGIDACAVERMGHLADQPADGIARQPGIRVQRDHEAHAGGNGVRIEEAAVHRAAQRAVERVQLATLALPPHPARLGGVPCARAMQQQETHAAGNRAVMPVQPCDAGSGRRQQRLISCGLGGVSVRPVRQQGEVEVAFRAGQMMHLKMLDLLGDRGLAGQQHRHGDQRAQRRGHAVTQVEARQRARAKTAGHAAIGQGDGRIHRRDQAAEGKQGQHVAADAQSGQEADRQGQHEGADQPDGAEVKADAERHVQPHRQGPPRRAIAELRLEGQPGVADQVDAGVGPAPVIAEGRRAARAGDGEGRDIGLGAPGMAGEVFDGTAVEIACREIHAAKGAGGRQHAIDLAHHFKQHVPVDIGDHPQAGDNVADGDVGRTLPAVLVGDDRLRAGAVGGEAAFEPAQSGHDRPVLVAQTMGKLDRKCLGKRAVRQPHDRLAHRHSGMGAGAEQPVGQQIGALAGHAAADGLLGEAAQVLDQDDPQGDRQRPQLADREAPNLLVGAYEPTQGLGIEAAVGVGDKGPGNAENSWVAGKRPGSELGKLAVVAGRQVDLNVADMLFDQMVVVDQPFRGRGDRSASFDGRDGMTVGIHQNRLVVRQAAGQRAVGGGTRGGRLGRSKAARVRFEAFDAEQFLADRVDVLPRRARRRAAKQEPHYGRLAALNRSRRAGSWHGSSGRARWPCPRRLRQARRHHRRTSRRLPAKNDRKPPRPGPPTHGTRA